jgi:integrase
MAGVTQTPSGNWIARFRDANRDEHSKTFALKRDALAWRAEQVTKVRQGQWIAPQGGKRKFSIYADLWISNKRRRGLKPSSVVDYEETLRSRIGPYWNSRAVGTITPSSLNEWSASILDEGLSAERVRKLQMVVKQILDVAVTERAIAVNPFSVSKVERPKLHYRLMTEFLCLTGLRISEFVAIKIEDLDFKAQELKVLRSAVLLNGEMHEGTPKSGLGRRVPMTKDLADKLKRHIGNRPRTDWLFHSVSGGQLVADTYRGVFKTAAESIGRPEMTPHNCRDTYASWAISLGVPVTAVSKALGHSDASITLKAYADFFPQDYDRLRAALSGVKI